MCRGEGLLGRIQLLPQIEGFSDTCFLDCIQTFLVTSLVAFACFALNTPSTGLEQKQIASGCNVPYVKPL